LHVFILQLAVDGFQALQPRTDFRSGECYPADVRIEPLERSAISIK